LEMDRDAQIEFYSIFRFWAEGSQSIPKTVLQHPLLASKIAWSYLRFR